MPDPLLSTLSGIIQPPEVTAGQSPTRSELIQWATGCMLEGLPDAFHEAWVLFQRSGPGLNEIEYKYVLNAGEDPQPFQVADELFPVSCIHRLDAFLDETDRNWVTCRISFCPSHAQVRYSY